MRRMRIIPLRNPEQKLVMPFPGSEKRPKCIPNKWPRLSSSLGLILYSKHFQWRNDLGGKISTYQINLVVRVVMLEI